MKRLTFAMAVLTVLVVAGTVRAKMTAPRKWSLPRNSLSTCRVLGAPNTERPSTASGDNPKKVKSNSNWLRKDSPYAVAMKGGR